MIPGRMTYPARGQAPGPHIHSTPPLVPTVTGRLVRSITDFDGKCSSVGMPFPKKPTSEGVTHQVSGYPVTHGKGGSGSAVLAGGFVEDMGQVMGDCFLAE